MINISKYTLWVIIILIILISIYYIFNEYNYSLNNRQEIIPIRKKINIKHYQSKKIYISPKLQNNMQKQSIKTMRNKLKTKLHNTNYNNILKQSIKTNTNKLKKLYNTDYNIILKQSIKSDSNTDYNIILKQSIKSDSNTDYNIILKQSIKSDTYYSKYIIKLFFANWCHHCVNFKPIWNKIKIKYSNQLIFENIDCTSYSPDLDYIQGLPTISIYNLDNKYLYNYTNDMSIESFESFIKSLI
jgi:thiol-disulfide isomerase/thioredoxin